MAGLAETLEARVATDSSFEENCVVVKDWTEESRYVSRTLDEASGLLAAINEDGHGLLPWLRGYW